MLAREFKENTSGCLLCPARKLSKAIRIVGVVNPMRSNQNLRVLLEASESTRLRMGESLPNHHEDHISGKGDNSLQHYNLVHKFIPMPQAMKFRQQKQQWIKNGKNWRKFRRGT